MQHIIFFARVHIGSPAILTRNERDSVDSETVGLWLDAYIYDHAKNSVLSIAEVRLDDLVWLSGSQPFMIRGPLLEILNTSGSMVINKIFCLYFIRSILSVR